MKKRAGELPQLWHLIKQQKIRLCRVRNTQQSVATVTWGWSDKFPENTKQFQRWNPSYVFPTWLGWCQILGIHQMVCFQQNGGAKSHEFLSYTVMIKEELTTPAYDLILGPSPWLIWNCSRFSNKKNNNDKHHLASDKHHQVCLKLWAWLQQQPGHKVSSTELTTQVQCSLRAKFSHVQS